jgi:hypothetical protein
MDLHDRFEQFEAEFLKFERIEKPLSPRRDIHAFLLLDQIVPGKRPIISAAEHDEYYLDIECDEFAGKVTDDQIRDLYRCGIRYDPSNDCLCVFA